MDLITIRWHIAKFETCQSTIMTWLANLADLLNLKKNALPFFLRRELIRLCTFLKMSVIFLYLMDSFFFLSVAV